MYFDVSFLFTSILILAGYSARIAVSKEPLLVTLPTGAAAKYCNEYVSHCVCLSVCLSARISPEPHV